MPNMIYLDNIQVTQLPTDGTTEPEAPAATETAFPFTFEGGSFSAEIFSKRNSELNMTVVDQDGSQQLKICYVSTNNWLWLNKELKAGSTVTLDVTFDNGGTGDGMSLFCYGSKANGDPITEGTPTDTVPQTWYWGQGVTAEFDKDGKKKYTLTFTVYEDCYGISMMLGFGNDHKADTAIYLDNITLAEQ